MTNISAQDYRNVYENFYACMRNYLWPYSVLEELAKVEVDIYSAFINLEQLRLDFSKLQTSISDVCKEDNDLAKCTTDIMQMIELDEQNFYARIPSVQEVHPEATKSIRTLPDPYDEEKEEGII